MEGRDKTRMTIRIIAGAYLAYLGFQLFQSMKSESGNKALFIVMAIVFVVAGVVFAISGVKGMTQIRKLEAEGYYDEDDEDEENEENSEEDAIEMETTDAEATDVIDTEAKNTET